MNHFPVSILLIFTLTYSCGHNSRDNRPAGTYYITAFGAKGDSLTVNTAAIEEAVNACAKNGGGTVVVPRGIFITGSVRLPSHVNFCLEPGSVLIGSTDKKDYLYQKDFGFSGSGAGNKTGILFARDATDISITGPGTIDGRCESFFYMDSLQQNNDFNPAATRQGKDYMNPEYGTADGPVMWKGEYEERPGTMVIFSRCSHIAVSGVSLRNSPNWTLHFQECSDVKVNGITITNNLKIPNSDGIDLYDSREVIISGSNIHAGDDAIAVISSEFVTVNNCILQSRSSGIRVGYNVFNNRNSGNLLFNNILIEDSNRGIGIFQRRAGDMENMIFSDIIIHTRLHTGGWWGHGEPIHISALPGPGNKEAGTISNIWFQNITAVGESGIVILGSEKSVIKDISFDHMDLTIRRGRLTHSYGGNIDLRPVEDRSMAIFRRDIPALYASYVNNLEINDLQITLGDSLPTWFTYGVEAENFNDLSINGLSEYIEKGQGNNLPVVYLHRGKEFRLENITTPGKNVKTVLLEGVHEE